MIKKIIITRFPYESVFSGEEIHTLVLAEKLREKNFNISFLGSCPVLLSEFKQRNFKSNYFYGGVSLVSLKAFLIFLITFPFVIFCFFFLAVWIKFFQKTDLVYMLSFNEKILLTPWLKLFRVKTIWVEHSRIGPWFEKNPFLFLYRFWSYFTAIISVSHDTEAKLIKLGVLPKQIHFILNGINLNQFKNISDKAVQIWKNKKNIGSQKSIGLITRLYSDKGIDYFIQAFQKISQKHPNLIALIIGEGPEKEKYQQLAKNLPIRFLGKVPHHEIPLFLNSIDYFVLPSSLRDPFGLAPAEAMASNKPVIVTDVCGITDFMQNEKHGLIIPAQNANSLESALEKLIQNPTFAQKLAQNGESLAEEKFSLERMIDEYLDLLIF